MACPRADITLLHNQAATLDNVRSALDALLNGVRDGEKVVYFESSHGYRYPKGDTMVEVLCLYDAFLEDTELVNRSQAAPADCLTVITDSCHSGGLNKLFFPPTGTSVARAKVWQPPEDRAAIDVATARQVSAFKFFGRAATSEVGAVAKEFSESSITNKDFVPPTKDLGAGQLELNGLLFAACRADQTAAAGSPSTNNLSAFTYGLQQELNAGGGSVAVRTLNDRVGARLAALNMSQQPVVVAPLAHQRRARRDAHHLRRCRGDDHNVVRRGPIRLVLAGTRNSDRAVNMTTDQRHEGNGKPRAKKAAQRRSAASKRSASKSEKESDVTVRYDKPGECRNQRHRNRRRPEFPP